MSRKGNCSNNSPIENFFGRMKNNIFYRYEYEFKTLDELEIAMKEYMEYYNNWVHFIFISAFSYLYQKMSL